MSHTSRPVALVVIALLGTVLVGVGGAAATPRTTGGPPPDIGVNETVVVDADGGSGSDYRSLAAAVANASDGDTVRVRPGTYDGGVRLTANVTVVAPRGATVANRSDDGADQAFTVVRGSNAAPVVDGFTVVGFVRGVSAWHTSGDWVVRNTTFRDLGLDGVEAARSTGDWRVVGVTVRNVSTGVSAIDATGDWTLRDTAVRETERAIQAPSASGAWTARNVTVDGALVGVDALNTSGDWTLVDATVRDAIVGVSAYESAGDWTVADTRFRNVTRSEQYDFLVPPLPEGVAVFAGETTGAWTVRGSRSVGVTTHAIDATGAAPAGTARDNEFVTSGAACTGNVSCGGEPTPTAGATTGATDSPTPHPPSTPDPTDSPTAGPRAGTTVSPDNGSPTSRPPTHSREDGPLSRVAPALGVLLAALGLGYRARRVE